ncbi:MAG: DUF167 domain-containing protein [Betaproteobacteria bacterium]|nr:DUF167 domain-containing protein [Betaproteobacteria bacterium]
MNWWRRKNGMLLLELHVQPGAARDEVAGLHGGRLKIRLSARAVRGAANAALVEFLAARLGAARRDVAIVSGESSRVKRVAVRACRRGPEALLPAA